MRYSPLFRTLGYWTVLLLYAFRVGPASAVDTSFHYLAADPSLRAQMQNANVTMGQATYVGAVLQKDDSDQSWEKPYLVDAVGSVLIDPSGQWRMYYEMRVSGQEFQRGAAMATSTDGIHWTKPALNITSNTYTTSASNNFVNLPQTWMGGPSVFVDPNAPANQRYRMSVTVDESILYALTSSDGKTWNYAGGNAASSVIDSRAAMGGALALDSLNVAMWDANTQKYAMYGRYWYDGWRRGVYTRQSTAWGGAWTGERQFILDPANNIPAGSTNYFDIYTPGVQTYHGQYIGLPTIYHHPGSWGTSGAVYPSFMYSRDGTNWSMPDAYHPIIDLSAHGKNESDVDYAAYTATSMVEHDGQLYIYYAYFPKNHNDTESSGEIHLATLPEDRFMGIQSAPGSTGQWTTSAITLSDDPGRLIVNATVDGSLRVEVLDASTQAPLVGFKLADATPIAPGDFLDAVARWGGVETLDALAGRSIALRFTLDDATVYGFHFQPAPEPSTIALLAAGALALLAYAWRKRR
jgi:hypothetical protein